MKPSGRRATAIQWCCISTAAASDIETLCDDAAALQKKASEAGVRCTLTVKRGVVHAYPVITQLRETRETFAEMQHFFRREGVLCRN